MDEKASLEKIFKNVCITCVHFGPERLNSSSSVTSKEKLLLLGSNTCMIPILFIWCTSLCARYRTSSDTESLQCYKLLGMPLERWPRI